jgi:hypothetical protein
MSLNQHFIDKKSIKSVLVNHTDTYYNENKEKEASLWGKPLRNYK